MSVRLYGSEDKKRWDDYVMESRDAHCYHLTGWKDVVEKSFGNETYYLLSEEGGRINGILPLVHMKSLFFGNYMVSVPYFNYGGICADNSEVFGDLLDEAGKIAKSVKAAHIELRHTHSIQEPLQTKTAKVSMTLELSENKDMLFNSFPSKLRSQIRRPTKEGMFAVIGREEELDSFYKIFSINMRDLGTPVYSKEFFKNILAGFPKTTWICTVYTKEGYPAASGFLVGFKDMLEIPWASSIKAYNRLSPNMLLYWSILEFACDSGFKTFDFGRSTRDEATFKFKEQWGAKPLQLYWHYWVPLPELNPKNAKYKMAINLWKKMPVSLTKMIGPQIVRNLP